MPKPSTAEPEGKAGKKVLTEQEKRRKNQIWAWTDLKTGGNTLNLIFKNEKNRSYKLPKVVMHGKSWTIVVNSNTPNSFLRAIWKFIQTVYPLLVWIDVQRLRGRENDNAYLECEIAKTLHLMTADELDSLDTPRPYLPPDWSNKHKSPQLIAILMVKHIRRIADVPNTICLPDFDALEVMVQAVMLSEKRKGGDPSENIVIAKEFNDCGQSALYFAIRLKCEIVALEYDETDANLANSVFSIGRGMAPLFNLSVGECKVCLESELVEAKTEAVDSHQNKSVIMIINIIRQTPENFPKKVSQLTDKHVGQARRKSSNRRRYVKSCGNKSCKNCREGKYGDMFLPVGSICYKAKKRQFFVYKSDKINSRGLITRTFLDNSFRRKTHGVFWRKDKTNQYLKQRDQKKLASRRKNTKASEIKKSIKRRAEEKARQRASQLRKEAEIERQNQNIIEALMENGLTSKRIVKIFERNRGKSDESCSNQITQSQRSRRDNQNKNYGTDESKESNFSDEEKGDEEYKPLDHEHKKFKKLNDAKRSSQNVIESLDDTNIAASPVEVLRNNEAEMTSPEAFGSTTSSTPDEAPNQVNMDDEASFYDKDNTEESLNRYDHPDESMPALDDVQGSGELPQSQESDTSPKTGDEDEHPDTTIWDSPNDEPTYGYPFVEDLEKLPSEARTENEFEQVEDGSMNVEMDRTGTSLEDTCKESLKLADLVEPHSGSLTSTSKSTSSTEFLGEPNPANVQPKKVQNIDERQIVAQQHQHPTGHVHSPDSDYHSATDSTVSPELMDVTEADSLNMTVAEATSSSSETLAESNCPGNSFNSSLKRNRLDSHSDDGAHSSLNEQTSETGGGPKRPKRPCPQILQSEKHVGTSTDCVQKAVAGISSLASSFLMQPWCEKAVQDGQISRSDSEQAALMIGMWSCLPDPAENLEEMTKSLMEKQKAEQERINELNKQKAEEEQQRLMEEHMKREAERKQLEAENVRKEVERKLTAEAEQNELARIFNLHISQLQRSQNLLQVPRPAPVPISGRTPNPTRLPELEQEEAGHPILRVQNQHVAQQPGQNAPMIPTPSPGPLQLLQNIAMGINTPPHFYHDQPPIIAPIPLRIAPQLPVLPPTPAQFPNLGLPLNPAIFANPNFNQPFPFTPETLAFIQQYNGLR